MSTVSMLNGTSVQPGAAVQIRGVSHAYSGSGVEPLPVLRDVSLDVPPGQFVALIGPSGCGKSTLLHLIGGLLKTTAGSIVYDGKAINGVNTDVGYMTQRD